MVDYNIKSTMQIQQKSYEDADTHIQIALHKNIKRVSFVTDSTPKLNIQTVFLKELVA